MSDSTLEHSQAQSSPSRLRPVESWNRRLLSWVYPNRGWGSEQQTGEQEPAGKIGKPAPGKPAGISVGETR
jgi:hypothetical protein